MTDNYKKLSQPPAWALRKIAAGKLQEEMNSIYIYAAALEKENADLKAHLNGR